MAQAKKRKKNPQLQNIFSFEGRFNRKTYLKMNLAVLFVVLASQIVLGYINNAPAVLIMRFVAVFAFFVLAEIGINTKRLHDLNRTGWYQLIMWAGVALLLHAAVNLYVNPGAGMNYASIGLGSIITVGFVGYCLSQKGTVGENKYGVEPGTAVPAPSKKEPPTVES